MPNSLSHTSAWHTLWRGRYRSHDTQFLRSTAWILACIVAGVVIGNLVGGEKWPFLIALVVLPLIARWPVEVALGMFVLAIPYDEIAIIGGGGSGTSLTFFVGAAAVSILCLVGLAHRRFHVPPRSALWWSLFVFWCGLTCLWAIDSDAALHRLPTAVSLLMLYLISVSLRFTPNERLRIVVVTVLGGCLAAAFITREFYQGVSLVSSGRASLVIGNQETDPNGMAASLLLPTSLAIGLFFLSQKWVGKTLAMLAALAMGFCIFLTMSRGAALALIVIAVIYLRRLKKVRALIPVCLLLLLLLFVPGAFFERFWSAAASGGAGRVPIWIAGLEALKHFWVQGAGVNNFPEAYNAYAGFAPKFRGFGSASHNIYLGTWVELGIVGLTFFLLAIRSQFRAVRPAHDEFDPLLVGSEAAAWAILFAGFFIDITWRKYFWLSWILLAVATQMPRKTQIRVDS